MKNAFTALTLLLAVLTAVLPQGWALSVCCCWVGTCAEECDEGHGASEQAVAQGVGTGHAEAGACCCAPPAAETQTALVASGSCCTAQVVSEPWHECATPPQSGLSLPHAFALATLSIVPGARGEPFGPSIVQTETVPRPPPELERLATTRLLT